MKKDIQKCSKQKNLKSGFTLLELLVVVLIIGLLTSIAVPGYRKAVEKSKVADALTTMQAVAKSEHGFYLAKNTYTKDFADLDISLIDKDGNKAEDSSFETINYTFTLQDNNIKAERNNGEYTMYKDYESDLIHCLPREHYVCQEFDNVNKRICTEDIKGIWHNTSSKCYSTNKERCLTEYGDNFWHEYEDATQNFCGYDKGYKGTLTEGMRCATRNVSYNYCNGATLKDGAECRSSDGASCTNVKIYNGSACIVDTSTHSTCNGSTIFAGGKCIVRNGVASCGRPTVSGTCETWGSGSCNVATVEDGGVCIGRANETCADSTFKSGATCIAYNAGACKKGTNKENYYYHPGSTCQGEVNGGCGGLVDMQGTCIANVAGACAGNTYSGDGCCKGEHCPDPANDSNVVICQD